MIAFTSAKINIGLHVGGRQSDGYHAIESLLYPIQWSDAVEVIADQPLQLITSGLSCEAATNDNLCMRAYQLLAKDYALPSVAIYLHKCVPVGAGLGGGSADAVATLKLLAKLSHPPIHDQALLPYAEALGCDCPFFIDPNPSFVKGKGERLSPYSSILKDQHLVVLCPPLRISTAAAYATLPADRAPLEARPLRAILEKEPKKWRYELKNDFSTTLYADHPILRQLEEALYTAGAYYAALSGSGAALYGLFSSKPDTEALAQLVPKGYYWYECLR